MRTLSDILSIWRIYLKEQGTQRYLKSSRSEYLIYLIEMLIENGIDFDEAKSAKNQVIKFLTTEEGKKLKGKHKDWIANISDEFIAHLDEHYPKTSRTSVDSQVFAWIKQKYSLYCSEEDLEKEFNTWKEKSLTNFDDSVNIQEDDVGSDENKGYCDPCLEEIQDDYRYKEAEDAALPDPFDFPEEVRVFDPDDDPDRPDMIDKETWEWLKNAPALPPLILK